MARRLKGTDPIATPLPIFIGNADFWSPSVAQHSEIRDGTINLEPETAPAQIAEQNEYCRLSHKRSAPLCMSIHPSCVCLSLFLSHTHTSCLLCMMSSKPLQLDCFLDIASLVRVFSSPLQYLGCRACGSWPLWNLPIPKKTHFPNMWDPGP